LDFNLILEQVETDVDIPDNATTNAIVESVIKENICAAIKKGLLNLGKC